MYYGHPFPTNPVHPIPSHPSLTYSPLFPISAFSEQRQENRYLEYQTNPSRSSSSSQTFFKRVNTPNLSSWFRFVVVVIITIIAAPQTHIARATGSFYCTGARLAWLCSSSSAATVRYHPLLLPHFYSHLHNRVKVYMSVCVGGGQQ